MRVLVTSSRFPHALAEVRKFGSQGHEVYAADTFWTAPGMHSRYVHRRILTPSPALETGRFVAEISRVVTEHQIDLIVPAFEESLYLARHRAELPERATLFCPSFETLLKLHSKHSFVEFARELGLDVPRTITVRSRDELRAATREFDCYHARPAFSRGGTVICTNTGPMAGRVPIEQCDPSPTNPWLVQEFVRGTDVCTFSVARRGQVRAHCMYEHPMTIDNGGGITFVTVDAQPTLPIVQRIVEALDYDGQISFDLMRTDAGRYVLIECNPRPTAGVCMMPAADFVGAVFNPTATAPVLTPPGIREQIAVAVVRDMLRNWHAIPQDIAALLTGGEDAYLTLDDPLPGLFQVLSYTHLLDYRRHMGRSEARPTDLVEAQFYDVAWNGEQAPSAGAAVRAPLAAEGGSDVETMLRESLTPERLSSIEAMLRESLAPERQPTIEAAIRESLTPERLSLIDQTARESLTPDPPSTPRGARVRVR